MTSVASSNSLSFVQLLVWLSFWLGTISNYVFYTEVKVTQSCPTLCNPMDCTVYGILQARILEWVAFPFSRSSQPRDQTQVSCNAGDLGSIPGLERSAREGIGYPFQYSWASLVAQLVKNPPAMQETWVRFLGWEDPLEKGKATHSSILAWRILRTVQSMGLQRVGHD